MAITVGGKPFSLSTQVESKVKPQVKLETKKLETKSEVKHPSQRKTLIHKTAIDKSHEEPLLVVNGKVKKINKNSTYLIDMLITDEE